MCMAGEGLQGAARAGPGRVPSLLIGVRHAREATCMDCPPAPLHRPLGPRRCRLPVETPGPSPPHAGLRRRDPGWLQEGSRGELFRANRTSWAHKEALARDGWVDRARL